MLDDKDINKLKSVFATKEDFNGLATRRDFLDLKSNVDGLSSELKSFKIETRESFAELNQKIDDATEVMMNNHDKRIEALEEKVL